MCWLATHPGVYYVINCAHIVAFISLSATPAGVRLIIAASAAATLLYTPLIKRHLLAKNLVVASTIAVAPLAGALAAGAAGPGLRAVLAPSAFLFLGIMHREIMMDIQVSLGRACGLRCLGG